MNDLGLDKTFAYTLDLGLGKLAPNNSPFALSTPGAGPRHFAFHPSGQWMFSINELNSTIQVYGWDSDRGILQPIETVSTLPDGFAGMNTTAEVLVATNGNHIYGSNRGYDSVTTLRLDGDTGRLGPIPYGLQWTQGETPRHFAIDPSGFFLYAANQNTDNISIFRVDPAEGTITPTGQFVAAGNPVCVLFLA